MVATASAVASSVARAGGAGTAARLGYELLSNGAKGPKK